MDPIKTLRNEHRLIRRFIDVLAVAIRLLEQGKRPPRAFFDSCIEFVNGFSDGFHHDKEELVMFVQLAQKKNGAIDGRIEALRYQHNQGRGFIAAIAGALEGYAEADPTDTAVVQENVSAFISLLRHHIYTEDREFYPMARKLMTTEDLEALSRAFDEKHERHGKDTFQRFQKMVVDLDAMLADR